MCFNHSMSPFVLLSQFLFIALTLTIGCNGKKDVSPVSFVDGYAPVYLDDSGTVYEGNYYPFAQGYQWRYDGLGTVEGKMTYNVPGESQSENIDTSIAVSSTVRVLPSTSITVSGGTYTVFPIEESAYSEGEQTITQRYLENNNGTIYIRAIASTDGEIVEITDPVFIKSPLIVGESWESSPYFDIDELINTSEMDFSELENEFGVQADVTMDMSCKYYVIGPETMSYRNNSVETMRLDQRAEANITVSFPSIGSFTIHLQMTTCLNLLKDVGIARQNNDMVLTMNGKLTYEGETVSMAINMTTGTDLSLTSFTQNALSGPGKLKAASGKDTPANLLSKSGLTPQQMSVIMKTIGFVEKVLF